VLDIGGGTTDYILYADGTVKQSGCIAIGGDHITTTSPWACASQWHARRNSKSRKEVVCWAIVFQTKLILLKDDSGFAGKEIERETLNTIIHLRLRETLELLKRRLDEEPFMNYLGAGIFITGGCSLLNGIDNLAEEIFEMPAHVAHAQTTSGVTSAVENPQFSTAIGLIKYAQAVQTERPARGIGRILGRIFSGRR
jgi:Actin-like ATPase involved in cell division